VQSLREKEQEKQAYDDLREAGADAKRLNDSEKNEVLKIKEREMNSRVHVQAAVEEEANLVGNEDKSEFTICKKKSHGAPRSWKK